jgi:hypothetical protein
MRPPSIFCLDAEANENRDESVTAAEVSAELPLVIQSLRENLKTQQIPPIAKAREGRPLNVSPARLGAINHAIERRRRGTRPCLVPAMALVCRAGRPSRPERNGGAPSVAQAEKSCLSRWLTKGTLQVPATGTVAPQGPGCLK